MLQDLLDPFWFLNAHIFYRYEKLIHVYQLSKTKNGSNGVFEKEKGALLFVSLYT